MSLPQTRYGICVPTLNAGADWPLWLATVKPALQDMRLVVVDSSSTDNTAALAREAGAEVIVIAREEFNHGGTRNRALNYMADCDIVLFLTQDALPETTQALYRLASQCESAQVGAAFGRQLPYPDATLSAQHARHFNYPSQSRLASMSDTGKWGIKTAFLSNSFAAYRRRALIDAGGFPDDVILGEDMIAGARLLLAGWQIAYDAEARVFHSHNYRILEEAKRYFDIGVLHQQQSWLLSTFGRAEGEGKRFLMSELAFHYHQAPITTIASAIRSCFKYIGYKAGKHHQLIPKRIKQKISITPGYWK